MRLMNTFYITGLNRQPNRKTNEIKNFKDVIDRAIQSENDSSESEILDLTMGSLKPHHNWKHYGSVNGIPTVGKNNLLPRGGKVANIFCYHDVDQARTSTPSQTNPNVMFYRRSSSVMASNRSFNHLRNSNRHIGSTSNAQLF